MTTYIHARGFSLTNALEQYVSRCLDSAIGGMREDVGNLSIRLSDVNGPKGGADKCCRVRISIPRMSDVFVEDTQPDMYDAIVNASRKARQSLRRKLARARAKQLRWRDRDTHFAQELEDIST